MDEGKTIRKPRQPRSIRTKEKILEAAYHLFCEKGYYKTTTNEIAQVAGVSIGSLYSYFQDKGTILLEILDRYNDSFMKVHETISLDMEQYRTDPRTWFCRFIEGMIEAHRASKELNRELQLLRQSMPEVADVMMRQEEKVRQTAFHYLESYREMLRVDDTEAASIVASNLISSIVDQVVFHKNAISDERILHAGVDAVCRYLLG